MDCLLCGSGAYSSSVTPLDPRRVDPVPGNTEHPEEEEKQYFVLQEHEVQVMIERNRQEGGDIEETEWE